MEIAVEVAADGRQVRPSKILGHRDARQDQGIGTGLGHPFVLRIYADRRVLQRAIGNRGALPEKGRRDDEIVRAGVPAADSKHLGTHVVDVLARENAGVVINTQRQDAASPIGAGGSCLVVVHIAALVGDVDADTHREHTLHDRNVQDGVFVVVEAAVVRDGKIGAHRGTEVVKIRLFGDETNGAAHGTGAVQSALRSAQHFDAIQVEQLRLHGAVEQVFSSHGHFVDIDAHRRRSRRRTHAANFNVVEPRTRARLE